MQSSAEHAVAVTKRERSARVNRRSVAQITEHETTIALSWQTGRCKHKRNAMSRLKLCHAGRLSVALSVRLPSQPGSTPHLRSRDQPARR